MAGETIVLDPSTIAVGRTALDITSYVAAAGPNWGDAEITAYMADQQVGSTAVDYRLPNRTITIPLMLRAVGATSFATIRSNIEQKVGLFQRQGGQIGRTASGTVLYADIVNATLHLGGSYFQAYSNYDVDAVLTLECVPDWYGDEITLDSDQVESRPRRDLFFTEPTAVNGNHPGRVPDRRRPTTSPGRINQESICGVSARRTTTPGRPPPCSTRPRSSWPSTAPRAPHCPARPAALAVNTGGSGAPAATWIPCCRPRCSPVARR